MNWQRIIALTAALSISTGLLWAAENEEKEEEKKSDSTEAKGTKKKKDEKFKPYDEVITAEAKSDAGLFFVHRLEEKVFFEIPSGEFDRPFLWVTQLAQTQAGYSQGGQPVGDRVVRWEIRQDAILLRDVRYSIRAEVDDPVKHSVAASSMEPILAKFDIKAWGKDRAPVIDVTDLFLGDPPEFSAKRRLNASGADKARSFVESIKSFPDNIETKVLMTYKLTGDAGVVTVMLHHSMVRLPDVPMHPRIADSRVGYFGVSFEDYGTPHHEVEQVRYITRWRLEKKDPNAEISEPKKPIVFYVGREVPGRWQPYVKKGIEMWQPAFEKAGFKNAILAKSAPAPNEDPDWDAEDARYSVIRWLPATIENAYGPHVHDPRSGEIIEADIRIYHNILKLVRDWYFVQASPMDERAQKLPMPDELMGELLAYVVAHEVGHSIGLPHNMKASSSYTVEQLRDPEFTKKHGTEASIMDYGRFNYVAQPGDGAHLIPVIAPYDFFAIEWGYKQFGAAVPLEEEAPKLDEIAARSVDDPMLRFAHAAAYQDPTRQTEDLGSDPVEATRLGLLNIQRVATNLVYATSEKGQDYSLLENMFEQLVRQRNRELGHVVAVVGGVEFKDIWYGHADHRFELVPAERQRQAVQFLNEHGFQTPPELIEPGVVLRLQGSGWSDRVVQAQSNLLNSLISAERIKRMTEWGHRAESDAFAPAEMLEQVRKGIWKELEMDPPQIDFFRRNLQRAHVDLLMQHGKLDVSSSEISALARREMQILVEAIAAKSAEEVETKAHLDQLLAKLREALDPGR